MEKSFWGKRYSAREIAEAKNTRRYNFALAERRKAIPIIERCWDKTYSNKIVVSVAAIRTGRVWRVIRQAQWPQICDNYRCRGMDKAGIRRSRESWAQRFTRNVKAKIWVKNKFTPLFDIQKPYHLLKYHKRGLGILTSSGKRYSYYTTDLFLADIEKLRIAKKISESLAQCYIEALCIEIELEDGSYFYIDGHAKHVWSSKNIPKAFFTTLKRAERGATSILYSFQ